jgi:hypothetical protein
MSILLKTLVYVVGAGAMTLPATQVTDNLPGQVCTSPSGAATSKAERVRAYLDLKSSLVATALPVSKASFISTAAAAEAGAADAGPAILEPPRLAPTSRIFERFLNAPLGAELAARPTTRRAKSILIWTSNMRTARSGIQPRRHQTM